ncbi:O-antigen polysaccharide polymerase Wzy [Bariatricus sp. HCP28S3_C2]
MIAFFSVYILYVFTTTLLPSSRDISHEWIFLCSWLGIGVLLFIIFMQYKETGKIFTLYTIFIFVSFAFNFGQCLFWALGIHSKNEIRDSLYKHIAINNADILLAQVFFLVCILAINTGYMLFIKKTDYGKLSSAMHIPMNKQTYVVYNVSRVVSFVVIPITFLELIQQVRLSLIYGYGGLYYGANATTSTNYMILSQMFFTCLVGLLIGSGYRKKTLKLVYIIFAAYIILDLLTGDRGNWFYRLLVLLWMHHSFYKPFDIKKVLKAGIIALILLYILQAIVAIRDFGLSTEGIVNALLVKGDNPIKNFIFEMGDSMSVNIVILSQNVKYPFGNSYILALLAMVTMRIPQMLGFEYDPIASWFSKTYLAINYGAGFTMYAEAALNFGKVFAPLFIIFIGFLLTKVFNINERNGAISPLELVFSISTATYVLNLIRNSSHEFFKYWFLGCLGFVILVKICMGFKSNLYFREDE